NMVSFHERSRPENGGGQGNFANVLFDLPLALPMRDAGVPLSPTHGTVDKVLHSRLLGNVGQVLALLNLTFRSHCPEILDTVNAVDTARGAIERRRVFQVSLQHFDA